MGKKIAHGTRKPGSYVTQPCPVCGKEYGYYKCRPVQTCSRACHLQLKFPDARVATNCPECGKEFWYLKSWPRKFCSRACAGKTTISNIPGWRPTAYEAICEQCGKVHTVMPKMTRGRFCSHACFGQWMKENAPSGPDNPKYGKKYGRPAHLPPPPTKSCVVCGKEFVTKQSHMFRRKCCSKECLAVLQSTQIAGANNFNWKGGYTPYYGPNWRSQRRLVRQRDNYTCQRCGITEQALNRELDVHHIRRFGDFADYRQANQGSNLVSLCNACHKIAENETA
jgi:endogenous inhibitor of DNA gyrase (YacG/DUF329 family)